MLETDVRAYILADTQISNLVGARMYPRMLPQNVTLPALVYQRVDTRRRHDMGGADGLPRARLQITCWAGLPADAAIVAQAVRARLDGVRGTIGTSTIGASLCVGERDLNDAEAGRSGVALDFMIQFQEV